jgi:hypothetical protein
MGVAAWAFFGPGFSPQLVKKIVTSEASAMQVVKKLNPGATPPVFKQLLEK